jgi:hypothetical protein
MIINNTPQNEAVLSNVGEIGEFRIRNSAKAFSILSSGLIGLCKNLLTLMYCLNG